MTHTFQLSLSEQFLSPARRCAGINNRSVSHQIEHRALIDKLAEENPDLPFESIRSTLLSKQQAADGELTDYKFG
jgi:hypothetical protein